MNQNSKVDLFENYPVPKALITMAVPTIVSQLINLIYNVVDAFFIGRTGNPYMVAATTICLTIFMFTVAFSNIFGIGGGSLVSRLIGIKEEEKARQVSAFSFYGAILIALAYSLFILLVRDRLLFALGASESTIKYARQYIMIVVVLGNLPTILGAATAHLLRNAGYSKQASLGLSMGGLLNIALDPLFMFVLLPEGYEVIGAAVATMLANTISCTYLVITANKVSKEAPISIKLKNALKISKQETKKVFSVGLPSGSLNALYDIANIVLNMLAAGHGDLAVAAVGIAMKVERLPNAVNVGICQGMLPIVAYNYSAGNFKRMKKTLNTARLWGSAFCLCTVVFYELMAGRIVSLFLNSSNATSGVMQTLAYAAVFLRIRTIGTTLQFFNYHPSFSLQAIGNGPGTLLHALVREFVFHIPAMIIMNRFFGIYGLVSGILIGEALGGILANIILNRSLKDTLQNR